MAGDMLQVCRTVSGPEAYSLVRSLRRANSLQRKWSEEVRGIHMLQRKFKSPMGNIVNYTWSVRITRKRIGDSNSILVVFQSIMETQKQANKKCHIRGAARTDGAPYLLLHCHTTRKGERWTWT